MDETPEIIKRPRGRPRKYPPKEQTGEKRPVGRPRKYPVDYKGPKPPRPKRPRGRPRKEKLPSYNVKRPNGRPRKHPRKDPSEIRPRGRPRKHPKPEKEKGYTGRKNKRLNGDWSDPNYKKEYQRLLMRKRMREKRGVKRHINKLDDDRLWSDVINEKLEKKN